MQSSNCVEHILILSLYRISLQLDIDNLSGHRIDLVYGVQFSCLWFSFHPNSPNPSPPTPPFLFSPEIFRRGNCFARIEIKIIRKKKRENYLGIAVKSQDRKEPKFRFRLWQQSLYTLYIEHIDCAYFVRLL